ncbi:hypothetical protein BB427_22455 [Pseudoalteromonas sp. BMB]|nr:hypothetical protein BB427_22455 [Pseudoalteromonas sp. BMB]
MFSTLKKLALTTLLTLTTVSVNAYEQDTNSQDSATVTDDFVVTPACPSFPKCWPALPPTSTSQHTTNKE